MEAQENRTWRAERIRRELLKLGIKVAKSTIQKYINQVRAPVPTKQTRVTFLRNHAKDIWTADFLQTYDLFLRTIFVFVVIEPGSRRLVHFGVTSSPNDAWVAKQLREATPFGEGPRFLIRDNDDKFGAAFDRVADGTDIEVLTTPYQAPKAICERFLGSVRRECLDFFLILSEDHLRKTMNQHQAYFNHARPHQGIDQRIPCPSEQSQQQNMGKTSLTQSSVDCVTTTIGEDRVDPLFPALRERLSRDSFPQPPVVLRCIVQQDRFPRQLSVEQMRTRCLTWAREGKPIGKSSCELLPDRFSCRFCPSATVLKWVEPVTNSLSEAPQEWLLGPTG